MEKVKEYQIEKKKFEKISAISIWIWCRTNGESILFARK